MKLNDVFPSKYIKADDLKGRTPTVVIAKIEMEKIGDDTKLVLYFQGKDKGMITNKTNAGRISYMYGEELNDWVGKEIVLAAEFVEFQGKTVQGLRVRPPAKRNDGPQPPTSQQAAPTTHVAASRGNYDVMERRKPEPAQHIDDDVSSEEIPF